MQPLNTGVPLMVFYVVCEMYSSIVLMTLSQYDPQDKQCRLISIMRSSDLARETATQIASQRDIAFQDYTMEA